MKRIVRISEEQLCRYREAYLLMARKAQYRPQAPGDGWGNIHLNAHELRSRSRLDREATEYAKRFAQEEDRQEFWCGCSDFDTNRAFIWTIEAARLLCAVDNKRALILLRMAIEEIENPPDDSPELKEIILRRETLRR